MRRKILAIKIGNFERKTLLYITCCLFTSFAWGQTKYTSPFTQDMLRPLVETIDREFLFSENMVTILTSTENGKDVQNLNIRSYEFSPNETAPEFLLLNCTSMDEVARYIIVIPQNLPPEYLDIIIPPQGNLTPQHLRFHLDI